MVAILFALMLLVLAIHFAVYLRYAFSEVFYPFEIFDAEGIIWQQAMLIPGPRMYGDIDRYPFLVFHYPPLYHSIVHGLAALGVDPLIAGRGLSVCASLAAGVAIGTIVFRFGRDTMARPRIYGALTAGLVFFCFYPVVAVSPLMRVDMLALALSVIGMRCALESTDAERSLRVAMIFFVLAAFTKQTSILAPLSVLIVVASVDPRRALRLLGFGLVLGGVPLACLVWATGGGVLRHLVLYNLNRFEFRLMVGALREQAVQAVFVFLAFAAVFVLWRRVCAAPEWTGPAAWRDRLRTNRTAPSLSILTIWLVLTTGSLLSLGKSGGGLNYFVEWMAVLSVTIGLLVAAILDRQTGDPFSNVSRVAILVSLCSQIMLMPASFDYGRANAEDARTLNSLVDLIRDAPKPVLSDDMVLSMKAGKGVPMEPAIFLELTIAGLWDEHRILAMIENRDFSFVIARSYRLFTPSVAQAIEAAYPRTERRAGHILHFPP